MLMHSTCKHGSFADIGKEPSENFNSSAADECWRRTSALAKVPDDPVKFMRWHRTATEYKGKQVMKTKKKPFEKTKYQFAAMFQEGLEALR